MKKSWQPYALHILDAIARIRRIRGRGDLTRDEVLYDAALQNLQTLSEATQLLPQEMKMRWQAIPWREISGLRNILVHNYLGTIDPLTIAAVIDGYLPPPTIRSSSSVGSRCTPTITRPLGCTVRSGACRIVRSFYRVL